VFLVFLFLVLFCLFCLGAVLLLRSAVVGLGDAVALAAVVEGAVVRVRVVTGEEAHRLIAAAAVAAARCWWHIDGGLWRHGLRRQETGIRAGGQVPGLFGSVPLATASADGLAVVVRATVDHDASVCLDCLKDRGGCGHIACGRGKKESVGMLWGMMFGLLLITQSNVQARAGRPVNFFLNSY
jgi:hypothetical protein